MEKELVIKKIIAAYDQLVSKDAHLFEVDANERSITHKFAEYLQQLFQDWNVDCEYNRNGFEAKKLETFKKVVDSDDTNAVSVYPDIIIHHRGTKDNLLIIEAKKTSFSGEDFDIKKLKAYKDDLGYRFAFKITLPTKNYFSEFVETPRNIQEIT